MQFHIKESWAKHTSIILVWKWLFTIKLKLKLKLLFFFPLLRCLFIIYSFYFRGLKMEIKSYIFNCELYFFFKLVFLLCFRLSALTSLCVTSQGSDMIWRTIAKTLTVDTTKKCFKFSLFCFCSSQSCILYLTFCCCFDGGCFRSNSCDLKAKPVKETNAFTLNRLPKNTV